MTYTAKIEQTINYKYRMRYYPSTDSFEPKNNLSLSYEKGFKYPYGWIKESGTPPCEHLDVIVITETACELGDELPVKIIGVFCRNDGDHKLLSVDAGSDVDDISELPVKIINELHDLYPAVYVGEGWFGKDTAERITDDFFSVRKRKIIITVQHTESEHHTNGMIGAQYDWELTERGRQQAEEIGKWLLWEDCNRGFNMYVSSQKRALQTAEGINKTLGIKPVVTDLLKEVNAGQGNGKDRKWYRTHEAPHPETFDIDYKPFPDAESDRELWNRITPFYKMLNENDEERILVVSHGTTLSFLHSMLLGYSVTDRGAYRFNGSGGSMSKFIIEPDGRVICHYLNHRIF
ncbi:MAG: histidine phosphatase family protein [Ruminococcus sp.]|nr:histidine phosphatase family protein [Ruminococcus sp.]